MDPLDTLEIEKQALAGLLKQDESGDIIYSTAGVFLTEQDFPKNVTDFHGPIFALIKKVRDSGKRPSSAIIAAQLKEYGISFKSDLTPFQYLQALEEYKINADGAIGAIMEVKKRSIARNIYLQARKVQEFIKSNVNKLDLEELTQGCDRIYNDGVTNNITTSNPSVNIYGEMERIVEERGNNPVKEGIVLPKWKRLTGMYGSLWRPANVTVIVARSGVGKTTIALDWNSVISRIYQVPIIHLDNGEMDYEELIFRQAAAESGVPMYAIEHGTWRKNEQFVKMVRGTWDKLKKGNAPIIHAIDVGGKNAIEILNAARREYFAKVGRGNPCILSFDYIKTSFENGNKQEHQLVGEMVDRFKQFIKTEMRFNNRPVMSLFSSVQQNRYGEGDNAISLSDRIKQFSSMVFILEKKTTEQLLEEPQINGGPMFGTHKLTNLKKRHMGEDVQRALSLVKLPSGELKENYINLKINNFSSEECGDLQDMVDYQNGISKPV